METLREIRFDDNDIFLKDNIVKTSVLPKSSKYLKRNIKIESNTLFEGSIFGNTISIDDGGVEFMGAVFANKELHVGISMSGMIRFNKAVASAESIAALVSSGRVIFGSDVNAPSVRLKNCYIGGSIFGSEVYLENCVNHFLIGAGALNSQILKVYSLMKSGGEKSEELTVENISDFFFNIISGVVQIQNISGEISFNELKKVFE